MLARSMIVFWLSLIAIASGCGPSSETHAVKGSARSAGMAGEIALLPEFQASQARLKLELSSVPPPARFGAGSSVFVAWDRRGGALTRLGTLELDTARGTARFEKVTPAGPFLLLVTAERDANVVAPSSRTLLVQPMSGLPP